MAKLSKRVQALRAKVDRNRSYPLADALALVKETANAKFDESVDLAVNLGIDAKKSDQLASSWNATTTAVTCTGARGAWEAQAPSRRQAASARRRGGMGAVLSLDRSRWRGLRVSHLAAASPA